MARRLAMHSTAADASGPRRRRDCARSRHRCGRLVAIAGVALSAILAGGCAEVGPGSDAQPANIVLVSIDCLNQRQFRDALAAGLMPTLEELAAESLTFTRAYAHAPWTTPSHMAMLTGLYPLQNGWDFPFALMFDHAASLGRRPEHPTLASELAASGYQTAAIVGGATVSREFGTSRGFDSFHESPKSSDRTDLPESVTVLDSWLADREPGPFFLFFHTFDFHAPRPAGHRSVDASLRYIDDHLRTVISTLKERDLYEETLIIVTGDHGSDMYIVTDRCRIHGTGHYDENLRVPLLLKLPAGGEAGESDRLARHVDLFPTVLDVVGPRGPVTYNGPGVSLLAPESEEPIYSFSQADAFCLRRFALASRDYKYIYTPRDPEQTVLRSNPKFLSANCKDVCGSLPAIEELYDLRHDPFEERNLAPTATGERLLALEVLREALADHLNLERQYRTEVVAERPREAVDPKLEETLRTLGYVQ